MTGAQSLGQLCLGLTAVVLAGASLASHLRLRTPLDFVLAVYVLSWALIVLLCLGLSAVDELTGRTLLLASLGTLALAAAARIVRGRPVPPSIEASRSELRDALRDRLVGFLGIVLVVAFAYSIALAFLTPVNDGDALAYHVARAAFWHQQGGIGYIDGAVDSRLNGNPPNAEIGMLFTTLLSRSDRYVALPQLAAYVALIACVAGLGRRIGLNGRDALFGALLFASLPVVLLQASTGLNDLVVASFLTAAACFALRPGGAQLGLFALALGLAVGTKFTAFVALPVLAAVVAAARSRKEWLQIGLAALGGMALGSVWYAVNWSETGVPDGGLADDFAQRTEPSPAAVVVSFARLLLDVVDLSGTHEWLRFAYLAVAGLLVALAVALRVGSRSGATVATGGLIAASPILIPAAFGALQDVVFRTWAALGRPPTPDFEFGWNLNVVADPALSWFGPLGVLLFAGAVGALVLWRRGQAPGLAVVFAVAPVAMLALLAVTLVWDPFRGRLVLAGVALAASTWGLVLRRRAVEIAVVAVVATAVFSSLANYRGKPSGIGDVLSVPNPLGMSVATVWGAPRVEVQARLRPFGYERHVLEYVGEFVPSDATIALAPRVNDYVAPYFGPRLSRTVLLVRPGRTPPPQAEWLVLSPDTRVRRCPSSWERELAVAGWRVERRVQPDTCHVPVRD